MNCEFGHKIFDLHSDAFEAHALALFRHQYTHNAVYNAYVNQVRPVGNPVNSIGEIPFLPISFFKSHEVKTDQFDTEVVFESSGTTGMIPSRHFVKDLSLYKLSFLKTFEQFYGPVGDWCIIGLLPSYLERSGSSLVVMVDELIKKSGHALSGFYLNEHEKLGTTLTTLEAGKQKTLLIGVSFGLLDFAEKFPMPLQHTIVMETGGMKGRREEITRMELHTILKNAWSLNTIHSEYGMTELLSQAYAFTNGVLQPPSWFRAFIREEDDPLSFKESGSGILNLIDLANQDSCAFIATEDVGIVHPDGTFEVQGRVDNSDLRGCSMLVVREA